MLIISGYSSSAVMDALLVNHLTVYLDVCPAVKSAKDPAFSFVGGGGLKHKAFPFIPHIWPLFVLVDLRFYTVSELPLQFFYFTLSKRWLVFASFVWRLPPCEYQYLMPGCIFCCPRCLWALKGVSNSVLNDCPVAQSVGGTWLRSGGLSVRAPVWANTWNTF